MLNRGTTDALFAVRRQKKYRDKKKLYVCFAYIEKSFGRAPTKMMRKKSLPEITIRALVSLYHIANTKVRVRSELFAQFFAQFGVHQGSALLPLLFVIAVNVIAENARKE